MMTTNGMTAQCDFSQIAMTGEMPYSSASFVAPATESSAKTATHITHTYMQCVVVSERGQINSKYSAEQAERETIICPNPPSLPDRNDICHSIVCMHEDVAV